MSGWTPNAHERRWIRMAISSAIQNEESLIDCLSTEYKKGPYGYMKPKVVPAQDRPTERRIRRMIAKWKQIAESMKKARAK